jgi:uncharacterized membrane protein
MMMIMMMMCMMCMMLMMFMMLLMIMRIWGDGGDDVLMMMCMMMCMMHLFTDYLFKELLEAAKAKRESEFLSLLQNLPHVNLNSIRPLALYIQKLYEGGNLTREEWCC